MADRFLYSLSCLVLVLTVLLWCSSGLGLIMELDSFPMEQWQFNGGVVLLACSLIFAAAFTWLVKHPLYEYWVVILIGMMTGICYVN